MWGRYAWRSVEGAYCLIILTVEEEFPDKTNCNVSVMPWILTTWSENF